MRCCVTNPPIRFYDFAPATASCLEKIVRGLRQPDKILPSALLYDARGLRLFDRILRLDGYCPGIREHRLLHRCGAELRSIAGRRSAIIEYGSGTSRAALTLLRSIRRPAAYLPVDVSLSSLKLGVARLRRRLPSLSVIPVRADFTSCFPLPGNVLRPARSIVYLSGSTFSTLDRAVATRLLQGAGRLCGRRGGVLVGVDLRTEAACRQVASRAEESLLRAFSCNALTHVNQVFGATFHVERFRHAAVYNELLHRVELRLASRGEQVVKIDRYKIRLRPGESIRMESSQRYHWHDFEILARDADTTIEKAWFDDDRAFALVYLRPARD
jgi:dimethylhistidine N-methyltransferase